MAEISSRIVYVCLIFSLFQFTYSIDPLSLICIKDILKFGHEIIFNVFEALDLMQSKSMGDEDNLPFVHRMEKELRNRISLVSHKIDVYQDQLDIRNDVVIARLLTELPTQGKLDQKLRIIDQYIGQINDLYYNFLMYIEAPGKYERFTLEDFAKTCVSSRSGALPDILKSIHRLLVPRFNENFSKSILVLLANQMQTIR